MRTQEALYPRIYDLADLYVVCRRAHRAKRDGTAVAGFEFNLERNWLALHRNCRPMSINPAGTPTSTSTNANAGW